jgi:hypothetical protein
MASVESWFLRFSQSVTRRLPRADWPPPTEEFWDEVRACLVRHGATEGAAREALSILAEGPPKFVGELIPALIAALKVAWKRSEVAGGGPPGGTFAEASAASRGCPDCGGMGQVVVFHRTICRSLTAHCECAAGRWLHAARGKDLPEGKVLLRLLDVKTGQTAYGVEQPSLDTLTDPTGTPLPEVWARNNPPPGAASRRRPPSGLGELVPVAPLPPRPAGATVAAAGAGPPDPAEADVHPES